MTRRLPRLRLLVRHAARFLLASWPARSLERGARPISWRPKGSRSSLRRQPRRLQPSGGWVSSTVKVRHLLMSVLSGGWIDTHPGRAYSDRRWEMAEISPHRRREDDPDILPGGVDDTTIQCLHCKTHHRVWSGSKGFYWYAWDTHKRYASSSCADACLLTFSRSLKHKLALRNTRLGSPTVTVDGDAERYVYHKLTGRC